MFGFFKILFTNKTYHEPKREKLNESKCLICLQNIGILTGNGVSEVHKGLQIDLSIWQGIFRLS